MKGLAMISVTFRPLNCFMRPSSTAPEITPKAAAEADSAAAEIEDPELRELVRRAARASLARAQSGRGF